MLTRLSLSHSITSHPLYQEISPTSSKSNVSNLLSTPLIPQLSYSMKKLIDLTSAALIHRLCLDKLL